MSTEAVFATRQARASADAVVRILALEGALPILGGLLILGNIGAWMMRRAGLAKPPDVHIGTIADPNSLAAFYAPPPASTLPHGPQAIVPGHAEPHLPFSFNTRVISFVIFFGSYLLLAWPLRSLIPIAGHWSSRDALRFTLILEISAYVPVVALTLKVCKLLAERESQRRFTWRETLTALGLWTKRPLGDLFFAVGAYSMTIPAIYIAALVSYLLFRGIHTPVHPVDSILLGTQDGLTRALIVIQAVIAAPIVEEMTFRGLLFEGFRQRWSLGLAAASSAAVFALSHNTLPGGFPQLWTLGFIFALVYRRRDSIVPNILMHAIHNGLVTFLALAVFSN
jgi:membrane protease YdiL (CAAX protease family)